MNYVIELERFLFAIMKCIMHFGYYNNFYIGVDFFFMVTGFFIAAKIKIENKTIQSALYIVILIIFSELTNYIIILLHKLNIKKIFIQEQV